MTSTLHDHRRWGVGDLAGAGNLLTPERRLRALSLVKKGTVVDLSQLIEIGAPRIEPTQGPYVITTAIQSRNSVKRRRALGATNDAGSNLERIDMTMHVGTHIDALGHFTIGDRMYGGRSAEDEVGDFGLTTLGIESCPPMITRGLCLDVAGLDGNLYLERGRAVRRDDLEDALARAHLTVEEGDVVLIRTGWGRFYMTDNPRYVSGEPGIDETAARWLTSLGAVAIGVDNMAVEVIPGTDHPRSMMPVHQHCLAEAGVYLIENLVLDGLVQAAITSFCLLLLSVKFKGATGCPVRPIAMV